ncbi:MAG: hypothetical protein AAFR35_12855 [Pseudomonadota bacterium]
MKDFVTPTILAYLVFWIWPICIFLFFRFFSIQRAICLSIVGAYLLLPAYLQFDFPVLPKLDKHLMPGVVTLLCVILAMKWREYAEVQAQRHRVEEPEPRPYAELNSWLPKSWIGTIVILLFIFYPIGTMLSNQDIQVFADTVLPGHTPRDIPSNIIKSLLIIIPFLLARRFLGDPKAHTLLLWVIVFGALAYILPTLYEVRLSPQLHKDLYGYYSQGFQQTKRGDGFRPVVFLQHGLYLALFLTVSLFAVVGFLKSELSRNKKILLAGAALVLMMTLILAKSLGALLIFLMFVPILFFGTVRLQLIFASCMALALLSYPFIRGSHVMPVEEIIDFAYLQAPERAQSLEFRFDNEEILLDRALERPVFGWGGWGRSRVYNHKGVDISTADGAWIITLGTNGYVGYFSKFIWLALPLFALALVARRYNVTQPTATLAMILGANLIYLIPNAGISVMTYVIAGALMGRAELGKLGEPTVETQERRLELIRTNGAAARTIYDQPNATVAKYVRAGNFVNEGVKTRDSRIVRRRPGSRIQRRQKRVFNKP